MLELLCEGEATTPLFLSIRRAVASSGERLALQTEPLLMRPPLVTGIWTCGCPCIMCWAWLCVWTSGSQTVQW